MPRTARSSLSAILKRPYWSTDDARVVLDALDATATTVADFARTHGIDPRRLYACRRRLRRGPAPDRAVRFVELTPTVAALTPTPTRYEITLPCGTRLGVEGTVLPAELAAVVAILRAERTTC